MTTMQYNEILALSRQVASLRNEMCHDDTDKELHKIFLRMVDELTDSIFKLTGDRQHDSANI